MTSQKISVIVPVYNIEDYIDECVKSIVSQTYENLEIIIVDDGSTDSSGTKIDDWADKDKRIKALHKPNDGQGRARNFGFDHSTGELIAYIDGDDCIDSNYFEKLSDALNKADADMAGCRFYRNNVEGEGFRYPEPDERYNFITSPEGFMERLYNDFGVFCVAWGKLYKREIIVKDMYPKVKIAEDAMVIRKLAHRCKKIAYISDALYMYRDRPGSIMTGKRDYSLANQKEKMQWLDENIEFYKNTDNNRLQALAEKAYCFNLLNDWDFFDHECKSYYRPKYYKALKHMLFTEGNSISAKCKYLAFGLMILIKRG